VRALRQNPAMPRRDPPWMASADDEPAPVGPLRCEVTLLETPRGLTLSVGGALDAHSVAALSAQFDQLQCTSCDEAVLDLREVGVIDCAGLNAVAGLSHYIGGRGGTLVILCRPGAIRGLLVSTGLGPLLEGPAEDGSVAPAVA